MTPETLSALETSIRKWERNARVRRAADARIATHDCPLCNLFFHKHCEGCPIYQKTGYSYCGETPYHEARLNLTEWFMNCSDAGAAREFRRAAREEVKFLKSLLPV